MHMKIFFCFILFLTTQLASATVVYSPCALALDKRTYGNVEEVTLLASQIQVKRVGRTDQKTLILTLGLKTSASSWTQATITGVEQLRGQRSLDFQLNPTDHYFQLLTSVAPGAGTGSGPTPNIKFDLSFSVMDGGTDGREHYLSFKTGMLGGFNRWKLYKLDFTDPEKPTLTYVKTYSYVQGQAEDM
jgi:hypothetical protein